MAAPPAAGSNNLTLEQMPATLALYARDQFEQQYHMPDLASQVTQLRLWPPSSGALVEHSSAPGHAKIKLWWAMLC
jgi:hypothetical protein